MIFKHVKDLSTIQAGGKVQDVVLTLPSGITMLQKLMILDAAELADLTILQMIPQNTAAALQHGLHRSDNATYHCMFLNLGASNFEVSLAKYYGTEKKAKTIENIEVLDTQYATNVGGRYFDIAIFELLADRFNSLPKRQGKTDIRTMPKVVKRLLKESNKIKEILSANKQAVVHIGEVADFIDLHFTLQRSEFEAKIQGLVDKMEEPIRGILASNDITLDQLDEVEMIGGGLRVPLVQKKFSEILEGKDLGKHLNGDEAFAFGASFIAANASSAFVVRELFLHQKVSQDISINITSALTQDCGDEQTEEQIQQGVCIQKTKVAFKKGEKLGKKKTFSVNTTQPLEITAYYPNQEVIL